MYRTQATRYHSKARVLQHTLPRSGWIVGLASALLILGLHAYLLSVTLASSLAKSATAVPKRVALELTVDPAIGALPVSWTAQRAITIRHQNDYAQVMGVAEYGSSAAVMPSELREGGVVAETVPVFAGESGFGDGIGGSGARVEFWF